MKTFQLDLSKVVKKLRDDGEEEQERGVGTVCLPEAEASFTGQNATVIGWGTTEEGGSVSNVLREVRANLFTPRSRPISIWTSQQCPYTITLLQRLAR